MTVQLQGLLTKQATERPKYDKALPAQYLSTSGRQVLNCREAQKMGVNETPMNEVESARRKKQSRMVASMGLFAAFVKFDYEVVDSCLSPACIYCQRCTYIMSALHVYTVSVNV